MRRGRRAAPDGAAWSRRCVHRRVLVARRRAVVTTTMPRPRTTRSARRSKQGNITDGKDAAGDLPNPCALVTVGRRREAVRRAHAEGEGLVAGRRSASPASTKRPTRARTTRSATCSKCTRTTASSSTARTRSTTSRRSTDLGDKAFVRTGTGAQGVDVQFVKAGTTVTISYSTVNIGVADADQVDAAGSPGRSGRIGAAGRRPRVIDGRNRRSRSGHRDLDRS